MDERRRVHLGIDYGTSTSKVVFRDYGAPGGERAYVVMRGGSFRIPSSVGISRSVLTLGALPKITGPAGGDTHWYESVKMRVAGEATGDYARYCYGPVPALPAGFTAKDLAVLSIWLLISEGYKSVKRYLGEGSQRFALGMTVGVPMGFFQNNELRASFLGIARAAWRLYRGNGILEDPAMELERARRLLDDAYRAVEGAGPVPADQVHDWIRSEAEAALWWPFQSPAVAPGPYAKVDIGAGTTNSSVFRIVERYAGGRWVKESLAFFGACSYPVGMDAVDRVLAESLSLPPEECLTLRGQEERLLGDKKAVGAVSSVLREIHGIYKKAWSLSWAKLKGSHEELKAWDNHSVFVIGGGSLVTAVREAVSFHPRPEIRRRLQIRELENPNDLEIEGGGPVPQEELPFVTVAYGLSNIGLAIPEAETPDKIPPLPSTMPVRERLDRDDIYAK